MKVKQRGIKKLITEMMGVTIWNIEESDRGFEVQMDKQPEWLEERIVAEVNQYTFSEYIDTTTLFIYK